MAAVVTVLAALLVDHGVAATLGAQVSGDARVAHAQGAGCLLAVTIAAVFAVGYGRGFCLGFVFCLLLLHLVEVHLQGARHCVGQRASLLHSQPHPTTPSNAAPLPRALPLPTRL